MAVTGPRHRRLLGAPAIARDLGKPQGQPRHRTDQPEDWKLIHEGAFYRLHENVRTGEIRTSWLPGSGYGASQSV